jgi:taurine dioxygenase
MPTAQQSAPAIVRPSIVKTLTVEQLQPALGAEVSNVNLGDVVHDADLKAQIERLWRQHKVLFFRDQDITHEEHEAFAKAFGELAVHPAVKGGIPEAPGLLLIWNNKPTATTKVKKTYENIWHSDVTFSEAPPKGSILRMLEGPTLGGDTMWCNMVMAYETLPSDVKEAIEGLYARHAGEQFFFASLSHDERVSRTAGVPSFEHPVVVRHPATGERVLFVNRAFTTNFTNFYNTSRVRYGVDFFGSEDLMRYLTSRVLNPEFQVRFKWRPNSIAMWDNLLTQHYAVMDYTTERKMVRATLKGERVSS